MPSTLTDLAPHCPPLPVCALSSLIVRPPIHLPPSIPPQAPPPLSPCPLVAPWPYMGAPLGPPDPSLSPLCTEPLIISQWLPLFCALIKGAACGLCEPGHTGGVGVMLTFMSGSGHKGSGNTPLGYLSVGRHTLPR